MPDQDKDKVYAEVVDKMARGDVAHIREIIAVNDRRYEQRFTSQESAISTALTAQKEAVIAAFAAAKEAVIKSEVSAEQRFTTLTSQMTALQQQLATMLGKDTGASGAWGYVIGASGLILSAVSIYFLAHH